MAWPPVTSRVRSSSPAPCGHRKPYCTPSSSYSSSSFTGGRIVPRSSPSSVSSHYYGNGGGSGGFPGFVTPGRGRSGGDFARGRTAATAGFASADELLADDASGSTDSISVTVRFRPLSEREYQQGDEIAWYADGDKIVRSEYNRATAYAFDRVFGSSTLSKVVYDVAARPVVKAAMEGINGTVFAYGVTSSGKTYTMHGDQNSPGIIPLAIKDVFSIIQDTPGREFLLRVSYLEIYNEVINDLLDPTGQNLRVREDSQGTYVEGIKEEVVLSPGHALSFIASGEEHRHVGSNNFNLFSSRSHTIFTLMIESSAHGDEYDGVTFSQLNLIDLAGSESSKTETSGIRRKEGSYINKSLLTLGTVIGKLSEGKASHIPYRDSKLTRLLQSSLSGHGHVSLICTVTPAASNFEETHNTLKFASRAKRVEIYASRNRIIDEKSLIKKYQKEISVLKEELEKFRMGMLTGISHDEIMSLRQQLEEGQVKMQCRLEEEEEAKAALMSRIQRLTKLILVSSKNSIQGCLSDVPDPQQHQSSRDDDKLSVIGEASALVFEGGDKKDFLSSSVSSDQSFDHKLHRSSSKLHEDIMSTGSSITESTNAGENASGFEMPMSGMMTSDQMDLLAEQVKMLAGEVSFGTSALKRLREQSTNDPNGSNIQIQNIEREIQEKQRQMRALEKQITEHNKSSVANASMVELQKTLARLMAQCNEKGFELELRTADNRILQEQLQEKCSDNKGLQEKILNLEQQLAFTKADKSSLHSEQYTSEEIEVLKKKIQSQEIECKNLTAEKLRVFEENSHLQIQNKKLAEEVSYAKELASAAAVELKNLAEEVTRLSLHNAMQAKELLATQELSSSKSSLPAGNSGPCKHSESKLEVAKFGRRRPTCRGTEIASRIQDDGSWSHEMDDLKMELQKRKQREFALEAALKEKEMSEEEYKRKYDDAKKRERSLENELAGMWVLVAKLKKGVLGASDFNVDGKSCSESETICELKENSDRNKTNIIRQKQPSNGYLKQNSNQYNQNASFEPLLVQLNAQIQEMKEEKVDFVGNGDTNLHTCKVCFEAQSAAVLLPCRHYCLCKPCSLACSECPVCSIKISDRIITFAS